MDISQALYTYLVAQSGITDLVSTRIYPVMATQNVTSPYIVYEKQSGPREHDNDGASGLAYPRFMILAYATTYSVAKSIADALRAALDGYSGMMGGESGVSVGAVFLDDESDDYEENTGLYVVDQEYLVWHSE